jgi:hypothetical protein
MSQITGVIDYVPEPDPKEHARRAKLLWLAAAVSLSMMAVGYIVLATMIF